jgi:hypothetical protein
MMLAQQDVHSRIKELVMTQHILVEMDEDKSVVAVYADSYAATDLDELGIGFTVATSVPLELMNNRYKVTLDACDPASLVKALGSEEDINKVFANARIYDPSNHTARTA